MRFSSFLLTISLASFFGEPKITTTSEACLTLSVIEGMTEDIGFPLREVTRNFTSEDLLVIYVREGIVVTW
jgi:hypothetical protein